MIPVKAPNTVTQADGFFISYNNVDIDAYGDVTTALVPDDHSQFFILNGDHVAQYKEIMDGGMEACLAYFVAHADQRSKFSDTVDKRFRFTEERGAYYANGSFQYVDGVYRFVDDPEDSHG